MFRFSVWIVWVNTKVWCKFHLNRLIGNTFTGQNIDVSNTYFPHCISGSPAAIYGQLPPWSWSTIGCHYSPQSLSSAAIRIHHQLPPRSWSTTTARCQHNKGSAIRVTTSQHDTESAILDPPLRSLIRDPQVVLHDVALDLRTIGQRNSGEEVKSVTCID